MIDRKRPSWVLWTTGVLLLPTLYVIGFGPAIWLVNHFQPLGRPVSAVYWPLGRVATDLEGPKLGPLRWYVSVCVARNGFSDLNEGYFEHYYVPVSLDGRWNDFSIKRES